MPPSSATLADDTATVTSESLSKIVTVAVRFAGVKSRLICGSPLTLVRVTITVSSPSTNTSANSVTSRVTDVALAGITMLVPSEV